MYESDILLAVHAASREDRKMAFTAMRNFGTNLAKGLPEGSVVLRFNDEEQINPITDTVEPAPVLSTHQVNQIHEIVKKALLAQDAATYHEIGGDLDDRVDKTVRKIVLALQ